MSVLPTIAGLVLATSTAHAGKLADGFRGIPYGPVGEEFLKATEAGCIEAPEPNVLWQCPGTIAEVPVTINYMGAHGLYSGVHITGKGYANKEKLLAVLVQAWGPGLDGGAKFEALWTARRVLAALEYNRFSHDFAVTAFSKPVTAQIEALDKAAAANHVGDL